MEYHEQPLIMLSSVLQYFCPGTSFILQSNVEYVQTFVANNNNGSFSVDHTRSEVYLVAEAIYEVCLYLLRI